MDSSELCLFNANGQKRQQDATKERVQQQQEKRHFVLPRGSILNRTYVRLEHLYVALFCPNIFGPNYYSMVSRTRTVLLLPHTGLIGARSYAKKRTHLQ